MVEPHEISEVTDVSVSADGITIALTIRTNSGASLPLSFQHKAFAKFLADMIAVGADASRHRTGGVPVPIGASAAHPSVFSPTLAHQIALAESADGSQMLVIRLFDTDLSFRVERPTLKQLRQALQALEADDSKRH